MFIGPRRIEVAERLWLAYFRECSERFLGGLGPGRKPARLAIASYEQRKLPLRGNMAFGLLNIVLYCMVWHIPAVYSSFWNANVVVHN